MSGPSPSDVDVLDAYAAFPVDGDSIEFYRGLLRRRLLINRCVDCRHWHHPPRSICPRCWSTAVRPEEHSGLGRVWMHTVVHAGELRSTIVTANLDLTAGDDGDDLRFTAPLDVSDVAPRIGAAVAVGWTPDDPPRPTFRLVGPLEQPDA